MKKIIFILIFICAGSSTFLLVQRGIKPSIQTTHLAENFYKIFVHNFVNMLVFNGPDGALLVDTGGEPVDLIEVELKKVGVNKIKYIINTHFDGDHVGGNAILGQEAVIISSSQCRDALIKQDGFPKSGLPNLTFTDSIRIHFNNEEIILYFMPGHSDNDIVVHFKKANIVCIGDFGFSKYPEIWASKNGNIYAMEKSMIRMVRLFSDNTLFVPGHGNDYAMSDLKLLTEMISEAIILVRPLIQQGLLLNQIKERNPLKNSTFSNVRENADKWIENIFRSPDKLK